MGGLVLAFDAFLAALLVWLAWQAIHAEGLFRAVISLMAFGFLMAVAWVRLDAPDIALAEAAIGAGITGALLLSALGRLPERERPRSRRGRRRDAVVWIFGGGASAALLAAIAVALPAPGLGAEVAARLAASGVDNPVTAVLLNFRALDTLLEIGVLLLGVVAVWSFGRASWPTAAGSPSPILPTLGRALFPIFVLVAAYVLWRGSYAPGGAFPAGAVLGAGGLLMLLAGARSWITGEEDDPWRWLLSLGVISMLAVALASAAAGRSFFEYPPAWTKRVIIALELAAAVSIAVLLFALSLCGRPGAAAAPPGARRGGAGGGGAR